jgi:radical SAM superfamily enzyme YgiQ (UPF0313 family)
MKSALPLHALLINPYVYDVSAYSFWSAPLGLLQIGAILRENGMRVSLLDCLKEQDSGRKEDGRAPYLKERVENRLPIPVGKRFKRYGLSPEEAARRLSEMTPPDLVLVTCIMTYWHQGAEEIVRLARRLFPGAKIVVGGLYVSLCEEHARTHMLEADLVVPNRDIGRFYAFLEETFSCRITFRPEQTDLDAFPFPAFDLYDHRDFVPLLTSFGCVYRCTYCAAPYLYPRRVRRKPDSVLREISYWCDRGIVRFALYDDNFLFTPDAFAKPLLSAIAGLPFDLAIYNPNALNASLIDEETARLLLQARFREVRLGLETIDPSLQKSTGGKIDASAFRTAVDLLSRAGFPRSAVRAYALAGLPLQRCEDVRSTIDYASDLGIAVSLALYAPIPHTPMFDAYRRLARYPIADEPVFQNNALFPFAWEGFTEEDLNELKAYAKERNAKVGR